MCKEKHSQWILGGLIFLWTFLSYAEDTLILAVHKNQRDFVVSLPANPTTGYQWEVLDYDKKLLQCVKREYIAPDGHLIGQGGHTVFSWTLIQKDSYPSNTKIRFKYVRSWEKKPPAKTQQVVVMIM